VSLGRACLDTSEESEDTGRLAANMAVGGLVVARDSTRM
jgi:hypothetical protein